MFCKNYSSRFSKKCLYWCSNTSHRQGEGSGLLMYSPNPQHFWGEGNFLLAMPLQKAKFKPHQYRRESTIWTLHFLLSRILGHNSNHMNCCKKMKWWKNEPKNMQRKSWKLLLSLEQLSILAHHTLRRNFPEQSSPDLLFYDTAGFYTFTL